MTGSLQINNNIYYKEKALKSFDLRAFCWSE